MAGKKSRDKDIPAERRAKDPWAKVEWWKKRRDDVPAITRDRPIENPFKRMLMAKVAASSTEDRAEFSETGEANNS